MDKRELRIDYTVYEKSCPEEYKKLCERALEIMPNAYSIYSEFSVGSAVLLESGEIVTGTNQENVAYSSGICAERVALNFANSKFPFEKVKAVAIAAFYEKKQTDGYVSPCGSCRQVFVEAVKRYGDFDVVMMGREKTVVIKASLLLPFSFDF
ncbi:cytidine deaminase [Odoribacter sp. OttesenSCG-928-G04]|nr:cytidine deaminase [Odoribacter sp. OttesenSCG-928-G04]